MATPTRLRKPTPTSNVPTGLVRVLDAAERHGVHPMTLKRWSAEGRFDLYTIPGHGLTRFIKATDLAKAFTPTQALPDLAK